MVVQQLVATQQPHTFFGHGRNSTRTAKPPAAKPPPEPTLLRSPAVAKQCVHLEPRYISNGEAHTLGEQLRDTAAKLNTRCSGCNGKTTLQRCNGGGGVNGLTTLAWCSAKCVDKFTPKEAT